MIRTWWSRAAALTVAALVVGATSLRADEWNERTILKFSEPVMIPGATLQPGSYVFQLLDSGSSRHVVQILREGGGGIVTTTQAVPTKRLDPKGDVVLRFNPTDAGTPPALKAWFYPGSVYGHEFLYPEDQAKHIAERTKTIALSVDVPGTDLQKGTIRVFNPSGARTDWKGDSTTMREWDEWQKKRKPNASASSMNNDGTRDQGGRASAPMVDSNFKGTRVKLDDLEENHQKFIGQTISVDAEVQDVFGPRLFTIDEPNWGDLDGEILVYMPTVLAALVKEDDRVTITGTVRTFVRAEVEREWGWLGLDREVEVDFAKKPVLVATRVVGGNNDVAMVIDTTPAGTPAAGAKGPPLTDLSMIDTDVVGRSVNLKGVKVENVAKDGGFFVKSQNTGVFVLPSNKQNTNVRAGDTVSIEGIMLEMPRSMWSRLNAPDGLNRDIYVYATAVTK